MQTDYKTEVHKRFGEIVQKTLTESNLNKTGFAELLGVSRGTVVNWMTGKVADPLELGASTLQSLARVRQQSLDALLEEMRGGVASGRPPKLNVALLIKGAKPLELMSALESGLAQMQRYVRLGFITMSPRTIADVIREAFDRLGKSIDDPGDFQDFLDAGDFRKREDIRKIEEIAQGSRNLPLGDARLAMRLAAALHKFADLQYEPEDLVRIAEQQEDRNGDRHRFPS
jgi:transcriptional regulator with XRE-family HTH domain